MKAIITSIACLICTPALAADYWSSFNELDAFSKTTTYTAGILSDATSEGIIISCETGGTGLNFTMVSGVDIVPGIETLEVDLMLAFDGSVSQFKPDYVKVSSNNLDHAIVMAHFGRDDSRQLMAGLGKAKREVAIRSSLFVKTATVTASGTSVVAKDMLECLGKQGIDS